MRTTGRVSLSEEIVDGCRYQKGSPIGGRFATSRSMICSLMPSSLPPAIRKTIGNWTLGQIFKHVAQTIHSSIDGTDMKLPWIMKKVIPLFIKKEKILDRALPPGYKIPKKGQAQFVPDAGVSTEDRPGSPPRGRPAISLGIETGRTRRFRGIDSRGMGQTPPPPCRDAYELRRSRVKPCNNHNGDQIPKEAQTIL